MCITTPLQQKIIDRTEEGDTIAEFLVDTMRGETPGVKVCHRMDAAKHLIKYGFPDTECDAATIHPKSIEGRANTPSPSTGEGWDGGDESLPSVSVSVTHLDIINYQIAHLIRHETAEGHTIVNFLVHIMTGRDRPFTPKKFRIKPADRMAAARELLRRGFGDFGSRRKLSDTTAEANAYDTLHTDLARRMREYSERGADTIRFLLEVMSDPNPEEEFLHHRCPQHRSLCAEAGTPTTTTSTLSTSRRMREYSERGADTIRFLLEVMSDPNPEEEFTVHHRMSAAQELMRRGWDTNYDNINPEHLQAYWRDKESSRLSIGRRPYPVSQPPSTTTTTTTTPTTKPSPKR